MIFVGFFICCFIAAGAKASENINVLLQQPVSLHLQNVSVRSILELLAQSAKINMLIDDSVKGNVSLNLQNISWQQAVNIILTAQGLAERKIAGVYLVGTQTQIAKQDQLQLQAQQQIENSEPLQSAIIPISYAKAAIVAQQLKQDSANLLSSRGNLGADERTNCLWIEDVPQKISVIENLVHQLDIPARQVLIEARIVNIDKNYENDLGIKWNIAGAENPNNDTVNNGLHIDLPAANAGQANGAATLGLVMAKMGDDVMLDLELSALENEGNAKIIATPQIITSDQKEALIQTGEEIPFQHATLSGATAVSFKKAVLSLKVTPQITPDGHVLLNLIVNQDRRGAAMVQGEPTIDTREIQSQVLLNNGETIVLGGIYQDDVSDTSQKIPGLSALPVVGGLFTHTTKIAKQRELLIFVTPRVIN